MTEELPMTEEQGSESADDGRERSHPLESTLESSKNSNPIASPPPPAPNIEVAADNVDVTPTVPRSSPPRPTGPPRPDSIPAPQPGSVRPAEEAFVDEETTQRLHVHDALGTGPPGIPSLAPTKKAGKKKSTKRARKSTKRTGKKDRGRSAKRKTVTIPDDNTPATPTPPSISLASGESSSPGSDAPPSSSAGEPSTSSGSASAPPRPSPSTPSPTQSKEQAPGIYTDELSITVLRPIQIMSDLPAVESKRPAPPSQPPASDDAFEDDETIEEIEPDRMSLPGPQPPSSEPPSTPRRRPPPRNRPTPPMRPDTPPPTEDAGPPKDRPWFEDLFDSDFVRTLDNPKARDVERETNFIEESLAQPKGARILDLACGPGVHAISLAKRGYDVVGLDLSPMMLQLAKEFSAKSEQPIQLVKGDMRDLDLENAFDGIYCWSTSFGFFEPDENLSVLMRVGRAIKPGGRFVLDIANRDFHAPRSPNMAWFQRPGVICMDEVHFNTLTSRLEVKRMAMFQEGRSRELAYSIRLYSLHEITGLLEVAGFRILEISGKRAHRGAFFDTESPRIIAVCQRVK